MYANALDLWSLQIIFFQCYPEYIKIFDDLNCNSALKRVVGSKTKVTVNFGDTALAVKL